MGWRSVCGARHSRAFWAAMAALVVMTVQPPASGDADVARTGPMALTAAGCITSGSEVAINRALGRGGAGAVAVLCRHAVFTLNHPVRFTAANQRILTQGSPTDSTRAILRLGSRSLTTAVDANNKSGVVVENVQVDGDRTHLGYRAGTALIEMGNGGSAQTIQSVSAYDTRSWTLIHVAEGSVTDDVPQCQGARIVNNTLGPAGSPDGTWADGISLACGTSLVQDNLITDVTDGGIVVFGAPGSSIKDNRVVAATRQLLGAINMVDYDPVHGNYAGTMVTGNIIDGAGAFIKVGIAMGPQVWGCVAGTNHGATVTGNVIQGRNVGYGFAVNGVHDWTVTGNTDLSRHVGAVTGGCGGTPSAPAGFQLQSATSSTLQPEFTSANLTAVLGISEADILRIAGPPSGCTTMSAGQGLDPGQALNSCDGRFALILQRDGDLALYQAATRLWTSQTAGKDSAMAIMRDDGNLVIYNSAGAAIWESATAGHPGAYLRVQRDGNVVIYDPTRQPLWSTHTSPAQRRNEGATRTVQRRP